jgi:Zn-dependent protease with chaperone function
LVDDPQLRALVAHEVIHIVHNDFRFARARATVAVLGGFVLGTVAWIASGYETKNLPIFIAGFIFGIMLIRVLLSPLNRRCEVRADLEGAALSGDARATAEALAIAHAQSNEARERLHGRPPWRWLLFPLSWRMPTHPRMGDRVARLNDLP